MLNDWEVKLAWSHRLRPGILSGWVSKDKKEKFHFNIQRSPIKKERTTKASVQDGGHWSCKWVGYPYCSGRSDRLRWLSPEAQNPGSSKPGEWWWLHTGGNTGVVRGAKTKIGLKAAERRAEKALIKRIPCTWKGLRIDSLLEWLVCRFDILFSKEESTTSWEVSKGKSDVSLR